MARQLGVDPEWLRDELWLDSIDETITKNDICAGMRLESLNWDNEVDAIRLSRYACPRSGPYVELDWLEDESFRREERPPRIFAQQTGYDRVAEQEARDLLQLQKRARKLGALDAPRHRALVATTMALRVIRPKERAVLLARLNGKRRDAPDATWAAIVFEHDLPSVTVAKEIFKVAVVEFLSEYARICSRLLDDPGYADKDEP